MITDRLRATVAAKNDMGLNVEHGRRKGLNDWTENSRQSTRRRARITKRFKSAAQAQRFLSAQNQFAMTRSL